MVKFDTTVEAPYCYQFCLRWSRADVTNLVTSSSAAFIILVLLLSRKLKTSSAAFILVLLLSRKLKTSSAGLITNIVVI